MEKFIDYNKLKRHSLTSKGFDLFVELEHKTSTYPEEYGRCELQPSNPLLHLFSFIILILTPSSHATQAMEIQPQTNTSIKEREGENALWGGGINYFE